MSSTTGTIVPTNWRHLKALVDPGHEENEPENGAAEEDDPGSVSKVAHPADIAFLKGLRLAPFVRRTTTRITDEGCERLRGSGEALLALAQ